jgi:manganese/zinc/iron transport system permease protein
MSVLRDLLFDYTLRTVALGAGSLGLVSGTLGAFAVLRRQSLVGDAISHAALPGIVLAFVLTGSKATLVLVLGAALAGWVGTLLVLAIVRTTRIPEDAALGILLSVFFGFGLVLLTWVQRMPTAAQAGLDRFLFGQAATLLARDVAVLAGLGSIALLVVVLFWKEFKLLTFDRAYGQTLGIPMRAVEVLLTTVLVLAIVIGLQTVGVVLMAAMVVAPAAAARQWTDALGRMVLLSALFGATAGVGGAVISASAANLPTGPTIVLTATALVAVSLFLAPARGLVWDWLRQRRHRREIRTDAVLLDLYDLAAQHADAAHAHAAAVLEAMSGGRATARTLRVLEARGLVRRAAGDTWSLTARGRAEADVRAAAGGERAGGGDDGGAARDGGDTGGAGA